jgi:hypothetical protein
MGYADRVLDTPYAWLLLAALLLAFVLRNLVLLLFRRDAPQRSRDRRLTLLFVFTAAAVALLTTALVLLGAAAFLDPQALAFFGVATALLSLALVFVRAVGIPLLFIVSAFVVLSVYVTQPWQPVAARTELTTVTVLSAAGDAMTLELRPFPGEPTGEEVLRLPGRALGVSVELVRYHPYWFLLGRRLGARVSRLEGYAGAPAGTQAAGAGAGGAAAGTEAAAASPAGEPLEDVVFPTGCTDALCRFIHARLASLPGIDVETRTTSSVPAQTLSRYTVVVEEDGSVTLVPR